MTTTQSSQQQTQWRQPCASPPRIPNVTTLLNSSAESNCSSLMGQNKHLAKETDNIFKDCLILFYTLHTTLYTSYLLLCCTPPPSFSCCMCPSVHLAQTQPPICSRAGRGHSSQVVLSSRRSCYFHAQHGHPMVVWWGFPHDLWWSTKQQWTPHCQVGFQWEVHCHTWCSEIHNTYLWWYCPLYKMYNLRNISGIYRCTF